MEKKKIDILEKLYLLAAIIDIIVLSISVIIISLLFAICVFSGMITFLAETGILIYQAIKEIINIKLLTGIGFLGTAIIFGFIALGLIILFQRLISICPKTIVRAKNFITLSDKEVEKKEVKSINIVEKRKILKILLIIALVLIGISTITGKYHTVAQFIETNFIIQDIGG